MDCWVFTSEDTEGSTCGWGLGEQELVKTGDLGVPACRLGFLGFAKKRCVDIWWIPGCTWGKMAAGYKKHNGP